MTKKQKLENNSLCYADKKAIQEFYDEYKKEYDKTVLDSFVYAYQRQLESDCPSFDSFHDFAFHPEKVHIALRAINEGAEPSFIAEKKSIKIGANLAPIINSFFQGNFNAHTNDKYEVNNSVVDYALRHSRSVTSAGCINNDQLSRYLGDRIIDRLNLSDIVDGLQDGIQQIYEYIEVNKPLYIHSPKWEWNLDIAYCFKEGYDPSENNTYKLVIASLGFNLLLDLRRLSFNKVKWIEGKKKPVLDDHGKPMVDEVMRDNHNRVIAILRRYTTILQDSRYLYIGRIPYEKVMKGGHASLYNDLKRSLTTVISYNRSQS
jgi:hypothetical protein